MTSTEQKIFEIIRRSRNKTARVQYIARFSGMGSDYVNLVCQSLHRRGYINFARGFAVMPILADMPTQDDQTPAEAQVSEPPAEPATPVEGDEVGGGETEVPDEVGGGESEVGQATPISSLGNLEEGTIVAMANAGYRTVGDLADARIAKLMQSGGMNVKQAADLINQARGKLGMIS